MKKTLYSLMLSDDVVRAVDEMAHSLGTNRSSLINQILPVKVNAGGHLMHAVADRYMMPCETERYAAYGDLLMYAGIRQKQAFTGTGYNENVRLMPDFSSRVYYLRRVDAALRTNGEEGAL